MKKKFTAVLFALFAFCCFSCDEYDSSFFDGYYIANAGEYSGTIKKEIVLDSNGEKIFFHGFEADFWWSIGVGESTAGPYKITISDDISFSNVLFSYSSRTFSAGKDYFFFSDEDTLNLFIKLENESEQDNSLTLLIGYCSKYTNSEDSHRENMINYFKLYEMDN